MQKWILLAVAALGLVVTGCGAGIYSKQEFGPQALTGQTIQDLVQANGCPDVVGGNGMMTVVGWYRTEGFHVLGLFAQMEKKSLGAVIDAQGRVIATGSGQTGEGLTILGNMMGPVMAVETK